MKKILPSVQNKDQIKPQTDKEAAMQAPVQEVIPHSLDAHAVLKARARALAQEPQAVDTAREFLEIVVIRLASEIYGIESVFVREIFQLKDFTPLPGVPPFVLGIANVRGQILSVVDLKKFFDLPEKGLGQLNKLVILRDERMEFGILADEVLGTRAVALDAIQIAPLAASGIGVEFVRGVTSERVIILDAKKILSDPNIIVHQEAD